jgi:hypothetical protein
MSLVLEDGGISRNKKNWHGIVWQKMFQDISRCFKVCFSVGKGHGVN